MAAQSNVGVLVFSAMGDVVVLYNGQNSKTVWERQRQSEIKGKVKIPQKRKRFSKKKVPVKWAWLFSQKKKDDDDTFDINKLHASKSEFVVEPCLLKLLYHRQTLLLVSHTYLTAYLLQTQFHTSWVTAANCQLFASNDTIVNSQSVISATKSTLS